MWQHYKAKAPGTRGLFHLTAVLKPKGEHTKSKDRERKKS